MIKFRFSTLKEITTRVKEEGRILCPSYLHFHFGYFELEYDFYKAGYKEGNLIVCEKDFNFIEITEEFLKKLRKGELLRPLLSGTGERQLFYFDQGKRKLFFISRII